jgi:hypothetical protein
MQGSLATLVVAMLAAVGCGDSTDDGVVDSAAACTELSRDLTGEGESITVATVLRLAELVGGFPEGASQLLYVYLEPDRPTELSRVEGELRSIAGVEVVDVKDQADALVEFRRLFPEEPEPAAEVLPPSVEIIVADPEVKAEVLSAYRADAAVREITDFEADLDEWTRQVLDAAPRLAEPLRELRDVAPSPVADAASMLIEGFEGADASSLQATVRELGPALRTMLDFASESCGIDTESNGG